MDNVAWPKLASLKAEYSGCGSVMLMHTLDINVQLANSIYVCHVVCKEKYGVTEWSELTCLLILLRFLHHLL